VARRLGGGTGVEVSVAQAVVASSNVLNTSDRDINEICDFMVNSILKVWRFVDHHNLYEDEVVNGS
jgi:hypothetical protein